MTVIVCHCAMMMSGILSRSLHYLQTVAGEGSGPGWTVPSAQQRHSLPGPLASWIHQVSVCLDKEEEKVLVSRQLELLTARLAQKTLSSGAASDSMVRLLYIYLLGYDVTAALDHCVKLAGSSNILARKMGYLASSLMIPHSDKLLLLLTNSIIRDLSSNNTLDVQLGLVAAANIVNSSMLDLLPLLVCRAAGLLSHRSHLVRSKSLVLLDWLCQLDPSQWPPVCTAVIHCLEDTNPGVVIFAVQVLSRHLSDSDGHTRLVIGAVMELQLSLTDGSKIPSDYHYKGHCVPHLHIYCVKIYRRVASTISSDRSICDGVISLLQSCLTSHLGCKDLIIQALLYEVVLTVSSIEGARCLLPLCLRSLSSFLSSRHSSVVYCGLCGLEEIFRLRSGGTTREQEGAVLACLGHPDTNIQRRAAQLILLLASPENLVSIVDRVLAHLARARADYSLVLERLLDILEKFGENADCDWRAGTLLRIIQVSKNRQRDLMMERLKLVLSSCDEAEGDAATVLELNRVRLKLRSLLADIRLSRLSAGKAVPVSVLCLSVWCEAQFSPVEDVEAVVATILETGRAEVSQVPVVTHCLQALQTLAMRHGRDQLGGAAITFIEENLSHQNSSVSQTAEQCRAVLEDSREGVSHHQSTSSLDLSLTFLDSFVVKSLESGQASFSARPCCEPVASSQLVTSSYSILQPSLSSPAQREATSQVKSVWTDEGRLDPENQEEEGEKGEGEEKELQIIVSKQSLDEPLENNVSSLNDDWD